MMARRFRRCSPLVFTISLLALLGSLFASVAQGEPDTRRPQTIGDMFWIWGNPELTEPGEHGYANFREASPAQRTRMLGATNLVMAGQGLPDDWDEGVRLTEEVKDFEGLYWEIVQDGGEGDAFVYEKRMAQVRALYDQYPQIDGLVLDDMSSVARSRGFKPEHIRQIRAELYGKYAALELVGVVYTMNLYDDDMADYIRELDVIMLPEWHGAKVGDMEKHVAYLQKNFPDKPIIFCTYLYDYGAGRRMPQELLQKQFEIALKLAHEGRIAGIEITTIDNDEEAVRWTAEWISSVVDQPIKNPTPKSYLEPQTRAIDKLYFMFHPICWTISMQGDQPPPLPEGFDPADFVATWEREKIVVERQKEFISQMGPNDALIMFPISSHALMKELEEHGTKELGDRCVIIRRGGQDPPAAWGELEQPIREFLENKELDGRAEFVNQLPVSLRAEMEDEIREACQAVGHDWNIATLEILYTSRLYALDIEQEFAQRGLRYDAETVQSEAFGEGFEECAMNWKAMVVPYMGLQNPADNIYDLSVSALRFLHKAKLHERIKLEGDTRLYLWRGDDGQAVGMFARSQCRIKDRQIYAYVPTGDETLEIWSQTRYGTRLWPASDSPIEEVNGYLKVPVHDALRRDGTVAAEYVVSHRKTPDELGKMLRAVRIAK